MTLGLWASAWGAPGPGGHLLVALGDPTVSPHLASVDPRFGEVVPLNNAQVLMPRADASGHLVLYTGLSNRTHVVSMVSMDHPSLDATVLQGKTDDFAVCWLGNRSFLAVDGADLCQVGMNGSIERRITRAPSAPLRADVTRDGKAIYLQDGNSIAHLDLKTGKSQKLFSGAWPRLSHDGHRLVFLDGARLMACTLPQGTPRPLANLNTALQATSPAFSPDDAFVAWIAAMPDGSAASIQIVTRTGKFVKALPLLAPAGSLDWTR